MRTRLSERDSFWLSLLLHGLALVIYVLWQWRHPILEPEKKPALYVPSYVYNSVPTQTMSAKPPSPDRAEAKQHKQSESTQREELAMRESATQENDVTGLEPLMAPDLASYHPVALKKPQQPVYMVGEKLVDDPLKKLLGIAISKRLYYPRAAQDLQIHGVTSVGFTLFPDGTVANVEVVKSSRERMLDVAALEAIKRMPPIDSVNIYVKKPRYLVVNIIFR